MDNNIYRDIAERTDGDIYIGVVGPVRTGKSTFIKKFMDKLVIPNIENDNKRERAIDELPQSAQGRTIMTTEPKFVPNEAVEVTLNDNAMFRVRMIDCVGYIVPGAMGHIEDDMPRMVTTPWFENEIPFEQAAELGTKKVIDEHSTIGLVVTTDGSFTEIGREDYEMAEERVINELKDINKPFLVLLNTTRPKSEATQMLKNELENKYGVSVMPINCAEMDIEDINEVIERVLYEFPLTEITINMPSWMGSLDNSHYLKCDILNCVKKSVKDISKIREAKDIINAMEESENVSRVNVDEIKLGEGSMSITIYAVDGLFYKVISEASGIEIDDDDKLMALMIEMGSMKKEYDKIAPALKCVRDNGYGIVYPTMDEMTLEDPEIVKQGNRYGVRLRASAPSIHLIRADIETEVSPIVGTERQSEELIHYLLNEFDDDPVRIWQSNIFGKSLNELVNEGLHNKLVRMPEDAQVKLQETLQRIINEGSGGLICIIL
ncbi:MAG: Stage IV sporulation protein A [Firmicutes bacterium ADurb.Bin193]|nr:MAG: Stage IV sporulation protein A [Firmicutes bacterium ADurb.Bin193]